MQTASDLKNAVLEDLQRLERLDVPSVRAVRRRYSKALKNKPGLDVLAFVRCLLDGATFAERAIAFEVLGDHQEAFTLVTDQLVEEMAEGLSDWASVDLFGVTVLGQAWRENLVSDHKIHEWTKSPNRWRRRLALVATVPLNARARGGTVDSRRTLQICRLLIKDRDDMVVKAMSWALRELSRRKPEIVEEFIKRNEDALAARVTREVRNKLTTGLKTPKRTR